MYAQVNDPNCPVAILKKYLSKLNLKCSALFRKPKGGNVESCDTWYENKPLGLHKLESKMKDISTAADLSEQYTNHCFRATTRTMSITGHKHESSLVSYMKEPSWQQCADMCKILYTY